jgi:Phosphatidylethanolamine-binding protein
MSGPQAHLMSSSGLYDIRCDSLFNVRHDRTGEGDRRRASLFKRNARAGSIRCRSALPALRPGPLHQRPGHVSERFRYTWSPSDNQERIEVPLTELVRLRWRARETEGALDAEGNLCLYGCADSDIGRQRLAVRPKLRLRCRCDVGGSKSCFDPQSPPFTLSAVPAGTRQLRFAMKDLDAPDFVHGGGTITYDGQPRIPRGAFPYRGPCPPQGQHRYQWTVEAQDAAGKTLAAATIMKNFPPK